MWVITEFNGNSKSAFYFSRYSGSNVLVLPRSELTFWAGDHPKKSKSIFGYTAEEIEKSDRFEDCNKL